MGAKLPIKRAGNAPAPPANIPANLTMFDMAFIAILAINLLIVVEK
jgi:hypothetical protein